MTHKNIFTGSFDPPTLGHLSIIKRAAQLLGEVTVVVCSNLDKKHFFGQIERITMIHNMTKNIPNVSVSHLDPGKMLSSYIKAHNSEVLIRGLRNGIDLEYERAIEEFVREYGIREVAYLLNEPELANISSSVARNHLYSMIEDRLLNLTIFKYLPVEVVDVIVSQNRIWFDNTEAFRRD